MKKFSARLLSVLLVLTVIVSCVACGQTPEPDDNSTPVSDVSTTTAEDTTTTTTEGDTTTTEDVSVDDTTEDVSAEDTTTAGTVSTTKKPTSTAGSTTATTKNPTTTTTRPRPTTKPRSTTATTTTTTKLTTTTTTTTTVTTTTTQSGEKKSIKVLSMGHSFSKDAMEKYLWNMFDAAGYDEIVLAFMYIGGCPLEKHWVNVQQNKADYEYFKNTDGKWVVKQNVAPKYAIADEDWDYVTFQPSPEYGGGPSVCDGKNDYDAFDNLVAWVGYSATNPDVQVHYHLTWAFATDCRLWCFAYHNYDQMKMYNDLIAATKKYILPNEEVKGVIPCISSIQNARTSYLGDTFNLPGNNDPEADGYHLNDQGDYVASLTWFAYFSGQPASSMTYIPEQYKDAFPAMAEAVDNALKNPYKVTESSYK